MRSLLKLLFLRAFLTVLLASALSSNLCSNHALRADESLLTLDELLRGLEDVEAKTDSFRVDVRFERSPDQSHAGSHVLSSETSCFVDGLDRVRLERSETRLLKADDGTSYEGSISIIAAYSGTVLKQMEGPGRFTVGRVSAKKRERPWGTNPRNYITHYFDKPISQILRDQEGTIVDVSPDNVSTVETRDNYVERDESTRKYRFRIDKNFSVIEKSVLVKANRSTEWFVYTRISSADYQRDDSGVWLPTNATHESFDVYAVMLWEAIAPTLRYRNNFTLSSWELSPSLDDSTFEIDFEPGITVTDQIQGRTYKTPDAD